MKKVQTVMIALLLAACGAADEGVPTSAMEPSSTSTPPPELPDWFTDEGSAPDDLVAAIEADVEASYLGSMAVTWPDTGLGCSDGFHAQVLTPGHVVLLEADSRLVRVHASEDSWVVCPLDHDLETVSEP